MTRKEAIELRRKGVVVLNDLQAEGVTKTAPWIVRLSALRENGVEGYPQYVGAYLDGYWAGLHRGAALAKATGTDWDGWKIEEITECPK